MLKLLKRLARSNDASISAFEGIALACVAIALIIAVRNVAFSAPKVQRQPVSIENTWPGLPPNEPLSPFHPLKDK